ncbi:PaaI family thioesterase [Diaphorobacter caeni]|uniref:PaaI family thioesterase n=1 Tax=Diaphorobacter caeni TaxID=2784387 RepID=UPI00188FA69E|nr:PaaI family thioesterase [Diaphorobacter caeni]MBF5004562.1 PaaI family thioesterase [Diaphorobacter caeni]
MLNFRADIPFVNLLGFTLHRMENGESELHYTPKPEHLNSHGVTHGGATMTLLDVALSVAARSDVEDHGIVTIEMKSTFMAPARGPLVAKARRLRRTKSMAFVEGWVYDAEGELCTMATGTFRYVPRAKLGGHQAPVATD